jgi:hypothetical protein
MIHDFLVIDEKFALRKTSPHKRVPSVKILSDLNDHLRRHATHPGARGTKCSAINQNKIVRHLPDLGQGGETCRTCADNGHIKSSFHAFLHHPRGKWILI